MTRHVLLALGIAALCVPGGLSAQGSAQDSRFEDLFALYLGENAEGYLTPMAEILTASLNSGFAGPARIEPGFHMRLDLDVANVMIGDAQKVFRATTEGNFVPETSVDAPTIVGASEPLLVDGDAGTVFVFPAGLGLSRLGLVLPRLTLGTVAGTEATVRFFAYSVEDVGEFRMLGLGGRHSVTRYLPDAPVDAAVGFFYHTLTFADIADLTTAIATADVSLTRGLLTLYGGLAFETATMELAYDSRRADGGRVEIDLEGANGLRGTAGAALDVGIVRLRGDVSAGTQTIFTIGLALGG